MRKSLALTVLLGVLTVASCDSLDVLDLNNPGLDDLQSNPTPGAVNSAAAGLLVGARGSVRGFGSQNGYVSMMGILGRESYNFDPADPRFVTEMLIGPLDGGSPAFGGNLWDDHYANIRNANIVLNAVDVVAGLSDAEKEGVRGFAKTIQALDLLHAINTRDTFGAPIDVDIDPTGDPAPIASKAEVFARIQQLLDEGQGHLQSAGGSFSFGLSSGFAGFDSPASFLTFNRALKARVEIYLGNFSEALIELGASFLDTGMPLDMGVYHVFSTASGDRTNALFDPNARAIHAHPSLETDAQLQAGGMPDLRFQTKIKKLDGGPTTVQGITTDIQFTVYNSEVDPVPIIRNEELILLRAEANIGLTNLATAVTDLDFIRANSGGLDPYSGVVDQASLLDELLYNKRYSLLFEGGHRWIDMRRYGKLDELPRDLPTHAVFDRYPFPIAECDARVPAPAQGCSPVAGTP